MEETSGGCRQDEYLGVFESADAARQHLVTFGWVNTPLLWQELAAGSGPFESVCLYGMKPKSVLRARYSTREDFAILEFS